jgi:hypothetical protein
MHLRHLTGEKIKAITEAICGKLDIAPEQLPEVQWGKANSGKLWEAVAEATGFKVGQLRNALQRYKSLGGGSYRPEFETRLRAVAPQWFSRDSDSKKAELLAMALRGEPRPSSVKGKHPLGVVLCSYTNLGSKTHDPVFDQKIRVLAPQWFVDTAALKKVELLAMALRGEPKPVSGGKNKHPLGRMLIEYTNSRSASYDHVFDQEIRALAPHWFVDTAALNRAELKAMALRGEPRPVVHKHPLGAALYNYTRPKSGCYDPVFDQEIRALRPDWFLRADKFRNSLTTKKAKTP